MSITIRECCHSAETYSRAYVKDPDTCVSCAWIAKHGPAKRLYKPKAPAWIHPNFMRNTSGLERYRKQQQRPKIEENEARNG